MSTSKSQPPAEQRGRGPSRTAAAARGVGRTVRTGLLVAVSVFTTTFLLANTKKVEVNYIFGQAEAPLFVALALALLLGVLITLIAVGVAKLRRHK